MQQKIRLALIVLIVVVLAVPLTAGAAVVGRFTLVTGQVDLLKGGKIPGIPAKVQDGVEAGDIIRTKAKAKAQLTMVDDSVITMAPESRLALADYQYDAARGERRAVVRLFRGLVRTVVNRIIKTEEPDFIMETQTAVVGVRGTNFFTLVGPNSTLTALSSGVLFVTPKIAGVEGRLLYSMQFIQVPKPFLPQVLTPETLKMLENLMDTGLGGGGLGFGVPSPTGPYGQFPLGLPFTPDQKILQQTIPPVLVPQHQMPAPVQPAAPAGPSSGPSSLP
ncbi:MAG: FecR family protein [Desulfobaccales bacterium]